MSGWGRAIRAWAALLLGAVVLVCAPPARATGSPQIQLQTDADTVGVGDILHLIMTVQSGEAAPSDPQLPSTPGLLLRGQNASPSQTHISINGNRTDRWGLTVDFALQAQRTGTFKLAPSIVVGDTRFSTSPVSVRVVPAGKAPPRQAPQPQSPFGFSPFDPWKGLMQGVDPIEQEPPQPQPVNTDPRLALEAPRGALYFLHATVDKASVAVGEQVVFSVFEYLDVSAPGVDVDESDVHDATAADFVKHPLLREDQNAQLSGYASVGGRNWQVKLVRRWALFPLHAGDLVIGPMSVSVVRPRSAAGKRTTETLTVRVSEPPAAGRPAGYALGDVGHFSLTAQVTPREVEQGGAVGVHVELSGSGNVPSTLATPAREGVEWLTPEVHDQLGSTGQTAYGGKRSFDYVVRLLEAGDVALGDLSLPFWDPDQKRYDVARASLGVVHVRPSANGAAASTAAQDQQKLQGLPPPRDALEGTPAARAHLDDSRLFWLGGIGAWPVAFGLAAAGSAATRRLRLAWSQRSTSPAAELKERVAAAVAACGGTDARAVDAAIERALQAASVANAGVSIRGAVGNDVASRLEGAGVGKDTASLVAGLLRECEAARFSPDASDVRAARDRWDRARGAIRALESRA
jgi:hypothetical protein